MDKNQYNISPQIKTTLKKPLLLRLINVQKATKMKESEIVRIAVVKEIEFQEAKIKARK